jgi:hypothetical protein
MPAAHVYDLLPTLLSSLPTKHTYMIVNDQPGGIWEIMIAAYFKVLQQHIPSETGNPCKPLISTAGLWPGQHLERWAGRKSFRMQ